MNLLIVGAGAVYGILAVCYFRAWLKVFRRDTSLSRQWRYLSWVILVMASLGWLVIVPFAYLELLNKMQRTPPSADDSRDGAEDIKSTDQPIAGSPTRS